MLGISEPMISKVNEVLYRPYFRTRITDLQRAEWNVLARETSILPDVLPPIAGIAPDAEDDIVLATAVACHADFLVTGDKPFLALGQFQDTRLINPADFIVLMKRFS